MSTFVERAGVAGRMIGRELTVKRSVYFMRKSFRTLLENCSSAEFIKLGALKKFGFLNVDFCKKSWRSRAYDRAGIDSQEVRLLYAQEFSNIAGELLVGGIYKVGGFKKVWIFKCRLL